MSQSSYKKFAFKELTGKDFSPCTHAWQDTGGQAVLVWDVSWLDYLADWPGKMLGYSFMGSPPALDAVGNKRLQRVAPYQHPFLPGLWATRIQQVQPISPGTITTLGGTTGDAYAAFTANGVRVVVAFSTLPYAVLDDAGLLAVSTPGGVYDESLRFVEWIEQTTLETLKIENGQLSFAEGPAAVIGKSVLSPRYQLLVKQHWTLRWHRVADNYAMTGGTPGLGNGSPGSRNPQKGILGCCGFTNSDTFMGKPPGTLLCTGYRRTPVEAPTAPVNVGSANNAYPPRLWTFDISILEFDPPFDAGFPNHRGHLLLPQGQLGAATGTSFWYYATATGAVGGVPIYGSVAFGSTMFKSPN